MKKLLIAIVVLGLVGTPAFAADMAVKAPPPPPPAPVYNWTGWYVGGNVGGSWGSARTDFAGNGSTGDTASPVRATGSFASSNTAHPNGVIGGGQIGYNYQFSPNAVLGFEADIQASGERGSGQFAVPFLLPQIDGLPPFSGAVVASYQAKIEWFGTVRGRLGFLVGDQLLIYGTGGLAYGKVTVSGNANISAESLEGPLPFTPTTAGLGASNTNVGFSVGGGVEGRFSYWLSPNWTWKLEYLYLDLGSVNTAGSFALAPPAGSNLLPLTGTLATHTRFTDNILRVGLNYQFH